MASSLHHGDLAHRSWLRRNWGYLVGPAASVAFVTALALSAASLNDRPGRGDAPVRASLVDDQPAFIVNMPDRYFNLALKCAGRDLLVSHTREGPPVVVTDADACREGSRIPHVDLAAG
jgi:hypothetical protein